MRYKLTPNIPRSLSQVVVGCVDDARWRHVDEDHIDQVIRHERHHRIQRALSQRKAAELRREKRDSG